MKDERLEAERRGEGSGRRPERVAKRVTLLVAVLAAAACAPASSQGRTAGTLPVLPLPPLVQTPAIPTPAAPGLATSPTPAPAGSSAAGLVAVIVMENQSPAQVLGLPSMQALARQGAVLVNYSAVAHPSLPNYLALTSGSTWGIRDDGYHPLPAGHDLGHQLIAAGIPWRAYMESMTAGCRDSSPPYAVKHNPFAYYGGGCPPDVVPLTLLDHDLGRSAPPRFIWITPNLCNDDHDCSPATGDRWLGQMVPRLLRAPGYSEHGLIAIVWDEGAGGSDQAPALILSPDLRQHRTSTPYTHYSVLAAVESRLGLPRLGEAAGADPLTAVLG